VGSGAAAVRGDAAEVPSVLIRLVQDTVFHVEHSVQTCLSAFMYGNINTMDAYHVDLATSVESPGGQSGVKSGG